MVEASKTVTAHFELIPFTLTMAVSPGGSGTTSPAIGPHDYAPNTVVDISATPAGGYRFVNWTSTGGAVANPASPATTVMVEASKTVTAHFELIPFTLTMAVSPGGSGTTSPAIGPHDYAPNTVVDISATPAGGYRFVNWTSTGGAVANPASPATTVMVEASKTVTAHFELIPFTLTMAVSPGGSGTTSPAIGPHDYAPNTVVDISATPAGGYRFVNWTSTGGAVANPTSSSTTVTVEASKTVTAHFELIPFTLTMAVTPGGSGTTSPAIGPHDYAPNTVVDISATPAGGYRFVNWTSTGGAVANPTSSATTVTVEASKTVTAHFELIPFTLTTAVSPGERHDRAGHRPARLRAQHRGRHQRHAGGGVSLCQLDQHGRGRGQSHQFRDHGHGGGEQDGDGAF